METHSSLPNTEPTANFLDTIRTSIASSLAAILGDEVNQIVYASIEVPRKGPHDLTLAVPKLRAVLKNANPNEIAKKVASEYAPDDLIEAVSASSAHLAFNIRSATMMPSLGNGKRVVIEFSSPNIAKPFHADHMRSTVIGAVLSNLYAASGWEVIMLNYLGDWGTQYGLLAVGFEKYGSEEELETDPIPHLFKVYVAINNDVKIEETEGRYDTKEGAKDYFNRLEKGDPPLTAIWKRFRDLSILEYIKAYERLGVQFDVYAGESLVPPESINKVMEQLGKQGLLVGKTKDESRNTTRRKAKPAAPKAEEGGNGTEDTPGDGLTLAIDLAEFNLGKPVLQKPHGSTIYMVRDIAGAIDRYNKYHFDKMLYVVGDQQNLHFAQCFRILSLLKDFPFDASEKLEHINFGRVEGMATRSGDVVFLKEDIGCGARDDDESDESQSGKFCRNRGSRTYKRSHRHDGSQGSGYARKENYVLPI